MITVFAIYQLIFGAAGFFSGTYEDERGLRRSYAECRSQLKALAENEEVIVFGFASVTAAPLDVSASPQILHEDLLFLSKLADGDKLNIGPYDHLGFALRIDGRLDPKTAIDSQAWAIEAKAAVFQLDPYPAAWK